MDNYINVGTGEVEVGGNGDLLVASALGSCIAVVVYDPNSRIGGIAHVMLPGAAPDNGTGRENRYGETAVAKLLQLMSDSGASTEELSVILAGAGNVLNRPDDTICQANMASVRKSMRTWHLVPIAESLGGTMRRRVKLETGTGKVFVSVGDGPEQLLCQCLARHTPEKVQE